MRALIVLALAAGLACAAAPPAELTAEQMALLRARRDPAWRQAQAAWAAGKQAEAIKVAGEALAVNEAVYGLRWRLSLNIRGLLVSWEEQRGGWEAVAGHRLRMAGAEAALWGAGHYKAVNARIEAEEARVQVGRTPARRAKLREALALNLKVFGLLNEGRESTGLAAATEAVKLAREAAREGHLVSAHALNQLALVYRARGEYGAALPLLRKALALNEALQGEGHPNTSGVLHNLALLLHQMGDHEAALPLFKRALALTEEAVGRLDPDYPTTLHNLALAYQGVGDYRAALPLCRRALALHIKILGRRHHLCANGLITLAGLYESVGDFRSAVPLAEEALALTREVRGRRHPDYARALDTLAGLYVETRGHEAALPLYKEALAVSKAARGERHPSHAATVHNLATAYKYAGNREEALAHFEKALALARATLGENHPDYAHAVHGLAGLHHLAGDHAAALPLYKRALALREAALGERHPHFAISLNNLANLHAALGDHAAALPLAERALAITTAGLRANASALSDRQQLAAAVELRHHLDLRLSIPDAPRHPPACAHVLAWKGSLLLRQQERRLFLRLADDPETRAAAQALQDATRRLATLRLSTSATKEGLDALAKEQEAVQAALAALSRDFRSRREKGRPTPEQVAAALPDGAALIDFLFFHRFGRNGEGGRPDARAELAAFVHRRGTSPVRIDLGRAATAWAAVEGWRRELAAGKTGLVAGQVVKRLLWLPLEKHLEGAKVVLVSPDGALGTVPFAALPGRKGGTYLIEDVAVAVVPVPGALPELMKPLDGARLKPSLLAVGDLRYDPAEGADALPASEGGRSAPRTGRERFDRLPATAAEILSIRASFEKLFKGGSVTSLGGGEATKAAVRKALANVRHAHFATHGYFAPEAVKSASSGGGEDRRERRGATGWHPLLLSGLALSDANREPKPGAEDGILTALEVSEMDLSKLELAVLSACETGLGKVAGGEGLLGMQRAFQVAGARTVVASLWKVDDKATQLLMTDFYKAAWGGGAVSLAEALRGAQRTLLNGKLEGGAVRGVGLNAEVIKAMKAGERLPPYYWAAFVLSGDWR